MNFVKVVFSESSSLGNLRTQLLNCDQIIYICRLEENSDCYVCVTSMGNRYLSSSEARKIFDKIGMSI